MNVKIVDVDDKANAQLNALSNVSTGDDEISEEELKKYTIISINETDSSTIISL